MASVFLIFFDVGFKKDQEVATLLFWLFHGSLIVGLTDINLREKYNLLVLSTINVNVEKNPLGAAHKVEEITEVASGDTKLFKVDILVYMVIFWILEEY